MHLLSIKLLSQVFVYLKYLLTVFISYTSIVLSKLPHASITQQMHTKQELFKA